MLTDTPRLDELTEINLDDLFDAAGLMRLRNTPLRRLFWPYARRFALVAREFDNLVGEQGLARASAWLTRRMTAGAQVSGSEHIPATGPAVVLANHPGMTDTVALIGSLASRPDLRVIALDRPFLRALPNVTRHLILLPEHDVGRRGVVRAGVAHLTQGGALLTFPAGEIEPDPATFGRLKAVDSVRRWSDSFLLFARRVPQTRFIPAIVSNVISPEAQKHSESILAYGLLEVRGGPVDALGAGDDISHGALLERISLQHAPNLAQTTTLLSRGQVNGEKKAR